MQPTSRGFSLLELLVALSVFTVLLFLSVNYSNQLSKKNDSVQLVDAIHGAIQYAKVQAVVLHSSVVLAPLYDDWSLGMVLKRELSGELLHQWRFKPSSWLVSWVGVHKGNRILFSDDVLNAMCNGRFELVDASSKKHIKIIVNRVCRVV